jgi:hypothetical protein
MYFSLRWAEERLLCAYATLFSPTKVHGVCKFNAYWFFTFFWLTKGPPAKKKSQRRKFIGLTVDGRVRMLRSLARRREKYMGC